MTVAKWSRTRLKSPARSTKSAEADWVRAASPRSELSSVAMFHPKGPTLFELAREGLSSTQRGYDLLAPKFDFTPFRTPEEILDGVYQLLVQLGPFADGIDLCCGTGAGVRMLQPLCSKRVVGLDFSVGMLAEARRQDPGPSEGWSRAELVWSDVLDMSYEGLFDIATCFGALGHIPPDKEERFLGTVHRALRPGGIFAFVTAPMPPQLPQAAALRDALSDLHRRGRTAAAPAQRLQRGDRRADLPRAARTRRRHSGAQAG
jgi:ubiquinone/menaquinone biosynthesis C-methylase UbiE